MSLPVGCATQSIDFASKRLVLLAQIASFLIESLDALVESLDGGERHTVLVDGRNALVRAADTECGVEILRHGADMPDRRLLVVVAPLADRHRGDAFEDLIRVDGRDGVLGVAIADGASLPAKARARRGVLEDDRRSTARQAAATR